ncbi:hypothetical protein LZ575_08475 [Antarcticibacterium sp. 1MA-6-2]|uniref:hypothetical protein n=1 Tax=Antarcticibacterium sp. 1MA-6-2 TaxID=2908210 RepID=UPI001F1BCA82|nr:hypothetical protein [Antarcticibacterium sp. 1MA-6-2]UJH92507.1 hypothetical protein LZ575_08475 [Antarcticibacterium sp. 1MA-6-2]
MLSYRKEPIEGVYFYHNWHRSFSGSEDKLLTGTPRIRNIMRINERHFHRNRKRGLIQPMGQHGMGVIVHEGQGHLLNTAERKFHINNVLSHVEHFLGEELPSFKGETIKAEFVEDEYFNTWKYKIKKKLGRQTQPYLSMKEVNDLVLKEILFRYRNHNYSFNVATDLKSITFCIQL